MATVRVVGALLLLLLASGQKPTEAPRDVCLLTKGNQYDSFHLNDVAECFAKCKNLGDDTCDVDNLQRYWLHYEVYLVEKNPLETVDMPFVKALVQNFSTDISEDLFFSLEPSQIPRQVMKDEDQPPDRVRLPKSLFQVLPGNRSMVRLAITVLDISAGNVFKGPRLSQDDGSSVLNNRMVGLSAGSTPVTGLSEPVEITFSHQHQPPNVIITCVFWDVAKGDWASRGCSTEFTAKGTVCRCDHLTFFALLLRPTLDLATAQALTRISQAGCGASMIFLAFTMVLYIALRSHLPTHLYLQSLT